ncbi:MAG TPA: aldose epimerase family protein [Clostridia bacterium]|nr:aldose epimerase family protein [Clostridia bacterium]
MAITRRDFGKTPKGNDVSIYTLSNSGGMEVQIMNYGGIIVSISVPDKNGNFDDIALGYDNLEGYIEQSKFFGALIGRHANRIEDGIFEINGVEHHLAKNDGPNHMHGGVVGFDKVIWDAQIIDEDKEQCLQLTYNSPDGEENYPGNLDVTVTYSLTEDDELKIDYHAVTDKDTVINLSNHSYFNLLGHDGGYIGNHELKLYADQFTAVDKDCLTTGEILDVDNTPFDFTELSPIGVGLNSSHDQIESGGGYDHNWVLRDSNGTLERAAELYEPTTGRMIEVFTTKPGIQFYSGNFLDGTEACKEGVIYEKRSGLCLETQYFPNAMKHKHFPSPLLKAGDEYKHTTVYKFSSK